MSRSDVGPSASLSADLLGLLPGSDPKIKKKNYVARYTLVHVRVFSGFCIIFFGFSRNITVWLVVK